MKEGMPNEEVMKQRELYDKKMEALGKSIGNEKESLIQADATDENELQGHEIFSGLTLEVPGDKSRVIRGVYEGNNIELVEGESYLVNGVDIGSENGLKLFEGFEAGIHNKGFLERKIDKRQQRGQEELTKQRVNEILSESNKVKE